MQDAILAIIDKSLAENILNQWQENIANEQLTMKEYIDQFRKKAKNKAALKAALKYLRLAASSPHE